MRYACKAWRTAARGMHVVRLGLPGANDNDIVGHVFTLLVQHGYVFLLGVGIYARHTHIVSTSCLCFREGMYPYGTRARTNARGAHLH